MLTDKSTVEVIKKSRKLVSILFSDIEHSTRHWERRGDIDARLLIDRHNRLLFPVIRKYKGRIIKTLGDAIMAAFDNADNAIKAGIAMQQVLAAERQKDKYFSLRTRIGIHTGKCIVEHEDIFGDVVNVAAKIQHTAQANEILISSSTQARIKTAFEITPHSQLKLAGKIKQIQLFSCDWKQHENLAQNISADAILPILKRQKFEIISYLSIILFTLFFLYQHYIRFMLADFNILPELSSFSEKLPTDYPLVLAIQVLLLISFIIYLVRIDFISRVLLRILSGSLAACLTILLFTAFNYYLELPFKKRWHQSIYQSNHQFVEVINNQVAVKLKPSKQSQVLRISPKGEIYVYLETRTINKLQWDKVQLSSQQHGWIPRKILPAFGVAEEPLTKTDKFYFRYYDLYAVILAILAFIWGYLGYRIRPS